MAANNYEDGGAINDSAYDQDPDASDNEQVVGTPGDQNYPVQQQMIGGADQYVGQSRSGAVPPHQALRNTAQAIIAYLHGADAAPPEAVKQVEQSVDPQGAMDPNQRTVAGIQAAAQQGGPDAGFSFIQSHRQQYNAKQSFARAALNGVQGKPPDLNAAVNAANQAYYHMPDGQSVQFATNGQGVTATVNGQHFQLTPQQFDQWLDIGGAGQFDKVYEGGAQKVLSSLASPQQPAAGGPPEGAIPEDPNDIRPFAAPNVAAQNPRKYRPTPAGYQPPAGSPSPYESDLEQQAQRQFPWASQGAQREQYLARTQEARNTNEATNTSKEKVADIGANSRVTVQDEKNKGNQGVADTRAKAYVEAANLKSAAGRENARARLLQITQTADNERLRQAARLLSGKILSNSVTPADEVQINSIIKNAPQGRPATTPAGGGNQVAAGATRQVGSQTYVKHNDGKWYPAGQ